MSKGEFNYPVNSSFDASVCLFCYKLKITTIMHQNRFANSVHCLLINFPHSHVRIDIKLALLFAFHPPRFVLITSGNFQFLISDTGPVIKTKKAATVNEGICICLLSTTNFVCLSLNHIVSKLIRAIMLLREA